MSFYFCRIFSLLSAILHLGNICYKKKTYRDDSIDICNPEILPVVSELLEVSDYILNCHFKHWVTSVCILCNYFVGVNRLMLFINGVYPKDGNVAIAYAVIFRRYGFSPLPPLTPDIHNPSICCIGWIFHLWLYNVLAFDSFSSIFEISFHTNNLIRLFYLKMGYLDWWGEKNTNFFFFIVV